MKTKSIPKEIQEEFDKDLINLLMDSYVEIMKKLQVQYQDHFSLARFMHTYLCIAMTNVCSFAKSDEDGFKFIQQTLKQVKSTKE